MLLCGTFVGRDFCPRYRDSCPPRGLCPGVCHSRFPASPDFAFTDFCIFVAPGLAASATLLVRQVTALRPAADPLFPTRPSAMFAAAALWSCHLSQPSSLTTNALHAIRSTLHQHNHSTDTRSIDGLLLRAQQKESQGTLLHSKD